MMRVAHIVRRFSFHEWGGTESVVWNTALCQRAAGIENHVFATGALLAPADAPNGSALRQGVPLSYFPYFYPYFPMPAADRLALDKKGGNPYAPALFRAVARGGFDLIHVHCGGRLALAAAALAKRLEIPCVISLHGGSEAVPKQELARMLQPLKRKFPYGGILDRIIGLRGDPVARMDGVICISHEEQRLLAAKYPAAQIFYLPNGVVLPDGVAASSPAALPHREKDGTLRALCVGRIDYQKNQKTLIEALAAVPELKVTLIGPVTAGWYRDEILARARELGVTDRLTLIPGLPPGSPELAAAYRAADLFVLPSVHEPFGIVALEAWAAGLPVVAARVGGLKDLIRDGENGFLFDPARPDELAAICRRLGADVALRTQIAARAAEDVRAFSWPSVTARLSEIYDRLLAGKYRRAAE